MCGDLFSLEIFLGLVRDRTSSTIFMLTSIDDTAFVLFVRYVCPLSY